MTKRVDDDRCFFCKVYAKNAEYMFQGQPVCTACQRARRYVADLCTPVKQYVGVDPNWKSTVNPNRRNTQRGTHS